MKYLTFFALTIISNLLFAQNITVTELGRYTNGNEGACEISAYHASSKKLFITNAQNNSLTIVDVADVSNPTLVSEIDITTYGGGINSVISLPQYFAVAVEADVKQDNGKVVFFNLDGTYVTQVTVGALPDMLALTPDGNKILVANEGEPNDNYDVDPEGSVSIIDISAGIATLSQSNVTQINFTNAPDIIEGALHKPGTTWAQDLEPEYIAINSSSTEAMVVCQESNVLVKIDLTNSTVTDYIGLGFKDHNEVSAYNTLDVSDKDDKINIDYWLVKGVYQPDAIASFESNGNTYYATANEGDGRDYDGYSSETRVKDLNLDPLLFPLASSLQKNENLGRLKTFTIDMIGDTDGDGDNDEIYSYGGRSFSIWDESGSLVWDSGNQFEKYIEENHPTFFNCNDGLAEKMDSRSDDKGPEPEAITTGVIGNKTYAFIGLERQGGIMIYNITDPTAPVFETYVHNMGNESMIDIAPEGIVFVPDTKSHTGENLLIVSNEVSGTTTIYSIKDETMNTEETNVKNIKLYPNPVKNKLTIKNPNSIIEAISIRSLDGKLIHQEKNNAQKIAIDFTQYPTGVYLVSFESKGKIIKTEKVIKK